MFDFNQDPGEGNLNLRAYIASIVGPRRVVHGGRTVKRVPLGSSGKGIQLFKSTATGKQATFYEVWLPQSSIAALPGGGAVIAFASSDQGGSEGAYQITLTATQRFLGVLLNDDAIYATALTDALGGALVTPVPVVISAVVF
jgi:hypothetical protein